jgi:quinol monooxygenase YgiN
MSTTVLPTPSSFTPGTVYMLVYLPFKDESDRQQAMNIIQDSIEKTPLNEPDCIHFNTIKDAQGDKPDEPFYIIMLEIYKNMDAFQYHMKQPYVAENTSKVRPLFSGAPKVNRFIL